MNKSALFLLFGAKSSRDRAKHWSSEAEESSRCALNLRERARKNEDEAREMEAAAESLEPGCVATFKADQEREASLHGGFSTKSQTALLMN